MKSCLRTTWVFRCNNDNARWFSTAQTPTKSPKKIKLYYAKSTDPFINLATEDHLFKHGELSSSDKSSRIFFWWRNSTNVIIGRNQNPFKECHLENMERDNVILVRRATGGGAVFQDLGNSCFTFISNRESSAKDINNQIVILGLRRLGIDAVASGRNDLLSAGLKISGAAFKYQGDRACHHGTILIDVNRDGFAKYLNPDKKKLQSKGIESVQARVLNLKSVYPNITHDIVGQMIREEFCRMHESPIVDFEYLDESDMMSIPSIREDCERLKDWKWRYGETPQFNHHLETRFDWGIMDVYIESKKGIIEDITIFSDSLHPQMILDIQETLKKGVKYNKADISAHLTGLATSLGDGEYSKYIMEFSDWLGSQL